eukprot:1697207-Amphidinium_carterae.1
MDIYGDHALHCMCHGDRTVRHNQVRDAFADVAASAQMHPEREKAGLLPPSPQEDSISSCVGGRRPADVYLPRDASHEPAALDFTVCSGIAGHRFRHTIDNPKHTFEVQEVAKCEHLGTETACSRQGFASVPMVFESHSGAWSALARQQIDHANRQLVSAYLYMLWHPMSS